MKIILHFYIIQVFFILLAGCSPVITLPTPAVSDRTSAKPAFDSALPFTELATATIIIKSGFGTPVPDYQGVPLLPEARLGKPSGLSYLYNAGETVEEAQDFYLQEMELNGWKLIKREAGESSAFGGPTAVLEFQRGDELFNITMFFSPAENYTLVMLTGGQVP